MEPSPANCGVAVRSDGSEIARKGGVVRFSGRERGKVSSDAPAIALNAAEREACPEVKPGVKQTGRAESRV